MKRNRYLLPMIIMMATQVSALTNEIYTDKEFNTIKRYILTNIATKNKPIIKKQNSNITSLPGAIIASPSSFEQNFKMDYKVHWTRDAALTMQEIVNLYTQGNTQEKRKLRPYLVNYVTFEQGLQEQAIKGSSYSLGEPKYDINGNLWQGKWARPQNDGPALRALTLLAIAEAFIAEKQTDYVKNNILPMIRTDLKYIAKKWREQSYDLWEELKDSDHFFNKMVQRKALYQGAAFLSTMDLNIDATYFKKIADQITISLKNHWNTNRGYYIEALHYQDVKGGGLDSSIILGLLYGAMANTNDMYGLDNEKSLSTLYHLTHSFSYLYKINQSHPAYQLIGRYSNDAYDGNEFKYGNPWNLTSNLLAQYYYSLANILLAKKQITITEINLMFYKQFFPNATPGIIHSEDKHFDDIINKLIKKADATIIAVKNNSECHANGSCLHLAEQVDRANGNQVSAKDLTWGYATLLTALQERRKIEMD